MTKLFLISLLSILACMGIYKSIMIDGTANGLTAVYGVFLLAIIGRWLSGALLVCEYRPNRYYYKVLLS